MKCLLQVLTSNCYSLRSFFTASQEDNILLRCINIVVFEEKDLVNPIFLQCREFNENPYGACKRFLDD